MYYIVYKIDLIMKKSCRVLLENEKKKKAVELLGTLVSRNLKYIRELRHRMVDKVYQQGVCLSRLGKILKA